MKSPLYITGKTTSGKSLIGGIFTAQDTHGMPVEMSFMECQEKGLLIDWMEALADCWLAGCLKYDSFLKEAEALAKAPIGEMFKHVGLDILNNNPDMMKAENPVDEACKHILKQKKGLA